MLYGLDSLRELHLLLCSFQFTNERFVSAQMAADSDNLVKDSVLLVFNDTTIVYKGSNAETFVLAPTPL